MGKSEYKYKVYDGKIIKEMLENSRVFVLLLLFAGGITVGALSLKKDNELIMQIQSFVGSFALQRAGQGGLNIFVNSLLVNATFSLAAVFFSFSVIGYPFILMLPFARGLAVGVVGGYLYTVYKFTGLGYCILMIYPGAILSVAMLLLIFNESCEYSKNVYSKAILGRGQFEKNETRYFLIRILIFTAISASGALADAAGARLFSRFFTLA
ncbi:MAG: stage II sporulation protein M [Clostridia bacterium]|nr:stage II sporulation protein M [Clostridia bacterium]